VKNSAVALASILALAVTGCAGGTAPEPTAAPTATASSSADGALLARNGLDGLSVEEIIARLDADTADRTNGPIGSVRPDQLLLTDATGQELSMPITSGKFYLAMAPYVTKTHQCFNHNLATCQGELVNETIHATFVDDAGRTVFDEDLTTMANGFASTWVDRDLTGTLTITHEGKSVSVPVSTGADAPTCLSESLQLV